MKIKFSKTSPYILATAALFIFQANESNAGMFSRICSRLLGRDVPEEITPTEVSAEHHVDPTRETSRLEHEASGVTSAATSAETHVEFNLGTSQRFIDTQSNKWVQQKKCMSCHTVLPETMARIGSPGWEESVASVETYMKTRLQDWANAKPWYGGSRLIQSKSTELIMDSNMLTEMDLARSSAGTLSPTTEHSFELLFSAQEEDGSWQWIDYNLEPMESKGGKVYGNSLAAIAIAKSGVVNRPEYAAKIAKLKAYLTAMDTAPETSLWGRLSILQANAVMPGILSSERETKIVRELMFAQKSDGGWSMNTLGNWTKKGTHLEAQAQASDGYATAYALYSLKMSGHNATADLSGPYRRGITWLKSNQNATGSWNSASVNSTKSLNRGFMEDAATAYAASVLKP